MQDARVRLRGYPPRDGRIEVVRYPVRRRLGDATRRAIRVWSLFPVRVFATAGADIIFSPITFVVGCIWGYQIWKQRWEVRAVAGCCPKCDTALPVKPGDTVDRPHTFDCFHCHFRPELHFDAPAPRGPADPAPGTAALARCPPFASPSPQRQAALSRRPAPRAGP